MLNEEKNEYFEAVQKLLEENGYKVSAKKKSATVKEKKLHKQTYCIKKPAGATEVDIAAKLGAKKAKYSDVMPRSTKYDTHYNRMEYFDCYFEHKFTMNIGDNASWNDVSTAIVETVVGKLAQLHTEEARVLIHELYALRKKYDNNHHPMIWGVVE